MTVAVNLSSLQIRQADLVERVMEVLKETGLPPTSLELEITESALLQNDGHTLRVSSELKEAGIRLHMDDFGTGYSSLSYLTHFPIDVVKIDRSLITSLDTDAKHAGQCDSDDGTGDGDEGDCRRNRVGVTARQAQGTVMWLWVRVLLLEAG